MNAVENLNTLRTMAGADTTKRADRVPFPIADAFPEELADLRAYFEAVAEELQLPVEAVALSAMAFASVGVLAKAEVAPISLGSSWREPLPIWSAVILPSGSRKSALFSELKTPITEWEREEAERLYPEIAQQAEQKRILEERLKDARKKAVKSGTTDIAIGIAEELNELEEITPPNLLVTEATPEALAILLHRNGGRGLVASPEGDVLDIVLGRY